MFIRLLPKDRSLNKAKLGKISALKSLSQFLHLFCISFCNYWNSRVFGDVFFNIYGCSANIWRSVLPCWLAQIRTRSCKDTFKYTYTLKHTQYREGKRENEWQRDWEKGDSAQAEVLIMAENKVTIKSAFPKGSLWWQFSRFFFLF